MTEHKARKVKGVLGVARRLRHLALALGLAACGGAVGTQTAGAGGESHFLGTCVDACGAGLECISGVCTRSCVVGESRCGDLSRGAMCTNASFEPGAVAVCDVACERASDCDALTSAHACKDGFCREPALGEMPPTPGAAGAGGGPSTQPFAPECAEPLGFTSECSFEATCQELGCGDGFSRFDAQGCTRFCDTTGDCGAGQRCRYTELVVGAAACPSTSSVAGSCVLEGGRCSCPLTDDCPHPDICVDATEYPESLDCDVGAASCSELMRSAETLQAVVDRDDGTYKMRVAQACLGLVQSRLAVIDCPGVEREFMPECNGATTFRSECTFEQTCEQLRCGDGLSQWDAQGCLSHCQTSADCGSGQRCRNTMLALITGCASPGSEVEDCTLGSDGACTCNTTADCSYPRICVDVDKFPESADCAVADASCEALANTAAVLEEFLVPTAPDAAKMEECLQSVRTELSARPCP
jgi:hypothetical protein